MDMTNGGALAVRTLAKAGVRAVFALHGAHIDAIFQAAAGAGIRLVDVRHESAAGHAAEGWARTTRSLGVAVVTAGAGFTNAVTSMGNAFVDRTPVLYLAGAPALGEAGTNALQEGIDQVATATPVTKWAHQVNRPQDVPRMVAHAIRVATTTPTGPVFLNIPIDVGTMPIPDEVPVPDNLVVDTPRHPDPAAVSQILAALAVARRPIVLAGSEAYYADAGGPLRRFAERTGVPVFSDFAAHGLLPSSHPLYGGTGHKLAYLGDERPDLVLALGTRFGLFTLGAAEALFPADAKVVHVGVDGTEIGRVRRVDLGIVADPAALLTALTERAEPLDVDGWAATVRASRQTRREQLDVSARDQGGAIHPWSAAAAVAAAAAAHDAILVADGAETYHWLNDAVAQERPGSYLTHGHLGCMGIGLGLAIGAQVAHPDRRVLLVSGDGAIGFTIAEFDTMVRHRLPIVVVVMNNQSWGASERLQLTIPGLEIVGTQLGTARYDLVAAGFGAEGVQVRDLAELAPAIDDAFATSAANGRPICLDVRVGLEPVAPELELMMGQPR